ncbi:MAG: flagellar biosynthetic protein FliR [Treponema sp.]|nr:flagellar biosynthetic protein FliR [Treponema sp.]
MFDPILQKAPMFLLIAIRCFAFLMTMPLLSMRSVPRTAKIALSGYIAFFMIGQVEIPAYDFFIAGDGAMTLNFVLLALGEGLIGIILGFYTTIIFGAFSTAGQFTAFQMGFSAASTYDALAQVENPLMGQFFNFCAMLIFLQTKWFQKLFLTGLVKSFSTINAIAIVQSRQGIVQFMLSGLSKLFADALVISLPLMGTLLLISVCTGLLSKAAPQMNLLSEGFPIMILVSFYLIATIFPYMCDFFVNSFTNGFGTLQQLMLNLSGGNG